MMYEILEVDYRDNESVTLWISTPKDPMVQLDMTKDELIGLLYGFVENKS